MVSKESDNTPDSRKNRLVIKNLDFDESEIRNTEITGHKVQALLKEGLCLSDIALKSVERKSSGGNAKSNGLIIVEVEKFDDKKEIMKNKRKLKNNRLYENVYIENDLPYVTRNIQAAVRTVLKEISSQNNYRFVGKSLDEETVGTFAAWCMEL